MKRPKGIRPHCPAVRHHGVRRLFGLAAAMGVMACLLLAPGAARAQAPVKLAGFAYPPFYMEEEGEIRGIAVDLIKELFARLGRDYTIKVYPLKRGLQNLDVGTMDAIMILIRTPERERYVEYTEPLFSVRGLIWSAADREGGPIGFERLEDLLQYRIGVSRGYSYGAELDRLLPRAKLSIAENDVSNFRMLISHRIDVFPCNELVAQGIFKSHPELKEKVRHSESAFIEWVMHMGISKKSSLMQEMDQINAILADLKREGFIDAVVAAYVQ